MTRTATNTPDASGSLVSFVPRLAIELGAQPVPSWKSVDGSMLSADISGFTALSERLASKGKAGAEEITTLINTCFTVLIDAAYEYGGEVIKFGGDALLVLFRGERHERRAADAGVEMQRALHSSTAAKRADLTMTVGAAAGPFDVFVVGSSYRELLITGTRATEVIRLEGEAAKADTLVDPLIVADLPEEMIVRQEHGGFVISGSTGDAKPGPVRRATAADDLALYVPLPVIDQLSAFTDLGGEHRLVTVGFVMITGVADQIERAGHQGTAEALGDLVDHIVAACGDFGVTLLHTDIAPDGFKVVLCAGAPVSLGDTTDALLECALRIAEADSPFVIRQGVQSGRVFAGFLGSPHRRTYTLMGDPVNTAARMLGQSLDREVVAVESAVEGTRTVFESDALEPFLVKGKTDPITAHKVRSASGQVRRETPGTALIGRDEELAVLQRAINNLDVVVELTGAAGVGKTHLLDAAWVEAENKIIFHGGCTPYGAAAPYSVFRPLLRRATGIPTDASAILAGHRLTEIVKNVAPHLEAMLPLLAVPFGAVVDSTVETDALDAEFRRRRIHETVVGFLDVSSAAEPLLIVIEDAQWIDAASGELLNHLVSATIGRSWTAIVTRRPGGDWEIKAQDHVVRLGLEPLSHAAIRELCVVTSTRPLTDRDLGLVLSRADGNPLFAIELVLALCNPANEGIELPDSIEKIIASRFDLLDPSARRVVRIAAVLGNSFDEGVIRSMLGVEDKYSDPGVSLELASAAGAIVRRSSSMWAFNHALYRDTAYAGLPFDRRRRLHRLAARCIEQRGSDLAAVAPLLSLHYSEAGAHDEAWKYSLLAAEMAEFQHANSEAAVSYERALHAARFSRRVSPDERGKAAEALADIYYVIGQFDDAVRRLDQARRIRKDPVAQVGLMRKLGLVFERQGEPTRAFRWYGRAGKGVPARSRSVAWSAERAHVRLAEAGLHARHGDDQRCADLARLSLADAERAADAGLTALALERIHLGLSGLGQIDVDGAGLRALAIYEQLNDAIGMSRTLNNLGVEAYFESRWHDATSYYLRAVEAAERAGSVVLAANSANNTAVILTDQGHLDQALELFDDAERNYAAVGYTPGLSGQLLFSGIAHMRSGALAEAADRFERAREGLERLGQDMLRELVSRELELAVLNGSATSGQCDHVEGQLDGQHTFSSQLARCRAAVLLQDGDYEAAAKVLVDDLADPATVGFERGLSLDALARVCPDDPARTAWLDEAKMLLEELGVVNIPPLLPEDLTAAD